MTDEAKQSGEVKRAKAESGAAVRLEDLQPTWTDKDGAVHRKRILTGDRTTGKLHLGHYVGSLRNRVKLQHEFDTFILLADVQALTTHWEKPEILRQSVMDVALDYMAVGLLPYTGGEDDGTRAKIVIQSMVPAIAELTVYYGLVTPMSLIMDNPTTKAEAEQYGVSNEQDSIPSALLDPSYLAPIAYLKKTYEEKFPELGDLTIAVYCKALKSYWDDSYTTGSPARDAEEFNYIDKGSSIWDYRAEKVFEGDFPASHEINPREIISDVLNLAHRIKPFREHIQKVKRTAGIRQMTYGFLGYPVSQAADITFVNAHLVPVGEDQLPHIELTREIARRMNKQYGGRSRLLVEPQALIGGGGTLKALDGGAKMSKSLGNAIYLSDTDEAIWGQLKRAVTDPQRERREDPGRPEICNVFAYHKHFNEEVEPAIKDAGLNVPTVAETAELCKSAGIGCVECKKNLAAKLTALLDPIRARRADWAKRPDDLKSVLLEGTRRGAEEGDKTLQRLRQAMKIDYFAAK